LLECDGTKRWLFATNWLPFPRVRTVFWNQQKLEALTQSAFDALTEVDRAGFAPRELDDEYYYYTRYGSPLAYSRALDLLCKQLDCKECFVGKRLLDFGYGGIGHLRLLASAGSHVVGVDVDPLLQALYSDPQDTGVIEGVGMGENLAPDGSLRIVLGRWPKSERTIEEVGRGFDFIISKNTLKNGYIHPEKEVDKRMLVDLGVSDEQFLRSVAASLNVSGLFLIYNITPKQSTERYIPWADGRSPFSREAFKAAGLEVLEFDKDDSQATRKLGLALEWDQGEQPMDLQNDLFATYTLVRKYPPTSAGGPRPLNASPHPSPQPSPVPPAPPVPPPHPPQ